MRSIALLAVVIMYGAPSALPHEDYIAPCEIDLVATLAPPPEAGSALEHDDIEAVVKAQHESSPARTAVAVLDAEVSPERFANGLLGPNFKASRAPQTFLLLQRVALEGSSLTELAKSHWARPRPFLIDSRIHSLVGRPSNAAYPSGHTVFAYEMASILSNILPDRKAELFIRAAEYGQSRVIVGVHYPTDIVSGRIAGIQISDALFKDASFRKDLEKASIELKQALTAGP